MNTPNNEALRSTAGAASEAPAPTSDRKPFSAPRLERHEALPVITAGSAFLSRRPKTF